MINGFLSYIEYLYFLCLIAIAYYAYRASRRSKHFKSLRLTVIGLIIIALSILSSKLIHLYVTGSNDQSISISISQLHIFDYTWSVSSVAILVGYLMISISLFKLNKRV